MGLLIAPSSATRQLCKPLGLPGVLPDPLLKTFREKESKTEQKNKTAWKINYVLPMEDKVFCQREHL